MSLNPYIRRFINSFTSENIIALFSRYKNAHKEITESWAMLVAAKRFIDDFNDVVVIVVGDGVSPRTGSVFAYYTCAEVFSIDPQFNIDHWTEHCDKQTAMGFRPQRLTIYKKRIEEFRLDCGGKYAVVVWPHSHADMNSCEISNFNQRIDIAMPCCVPIPKNWMEKPHTVYTDYNVMSPKRDVHIWITK